MGPARPGRPSSAHFSSHHQPISAPKLSSCLFIPHCLELNKPFVISTNCLDLGQFLSHCNACLQQRPLLLPSEEPIFQTFYSSSSVLRRRRKVNFVRRQIYFLDWSCFVFSPAPLPPNHASITSPAQIMASALQRRFSRKGAAGAQASLCCSAPRTERASLLCFQTT